MAGFTGFTGVIGFYVGPVPELTFCLPDGLSLKIRQLADEAHVPQLECLQKLLELGCFAEQAIELGAQFLLVDLGPSFSFKPLSLAPPDYSSPDLPDWQSSILNVPLDTPPITRDILWRLLYALILYEASLGKLVPVASLGGRQERIRFEDNLAGVWAGLTGQ